MDRPRRELPNPPRQPFALGMRQSSHRPRLNLTPRLYAVVSCCGDTISKIASFILENRLTPIITHVSQTNPWTGVADGGNFGSIYRAPLAERPRVSVGGRSGMFLSTYVNKVDRKGRVSVPATFRTTLSAQRFPGIVVFPSYKYPAPEANGIESDGGDDARLDTLDKFSEEHENLWKCCLPLRTSWRSTARAGCILPEISPSTPHYREVAFVGLGRNFQLWEPSRFAEHQARCASARAARHHAAARRRRPIGAANDGAAALQPPQPGRAGGGARDAQTDPAAARAGSRRSGRRRAGACDDAVYVDGTFGGGGYSRLLLAAAHCRVLAIDRDPEVVGRGRALAARHNGRLISSKEISARWSGSSASGARPDRRGRPRSRRVRDPNRHARTRLLVPLRRPARHAHERRRARARPTSSRACRRRISPADRGARRGAPARGIARRIVAARRQQPIRRTLELADLVRAAIPKAAPGIDPATRTFQALRIAVNDELGELDRGLAAAERLLMPGGRLAVVAFHSLEDRRVKEFLRQRSDAAPGTSRHEPVPVAASSPSFRLLHRRALRPSPEEAEQNPRARSARLRAAERTAAQPWSPPNGRRERWAA